MTLTPLFYYCVFGLLGLAIVFKIMYGVIDMTVKNIISKKGIRQQRAVSWIFATVCSIIAVVCLAIKQNTFAIIFFIFWAVLMMNMRYWDLKYNIKWSQ